MRSQKLIAWAFGIVVFMALPSRMLAQGPLSIVQHPANLSACVGDEVSLYVVAQGGTIPLNYQWLKDGIALPGATSPSYYTFPGAASDSGNYRVVVTDATGLSVLSNAATVAITSSHVAVITSVTPSIVNHGFNDFTIHGSGFNYGTIVEQGSCGAQPTPLANNVTLISDTEIRVSGVACEYHEGVIFEVRSSCQGAPSYGNATVVMPTPDVVDVQVSPGPCMDSWVLAVTLSGALPSSPFFDQWSPIIDGVSGYAASVIFFPQSFQITLPAYALAPGTHSLQFEWSRRNTCSNLVYVHSDVFNFEVGDGPNALWLTQPSGVGSLGVQRSNSLQNADAWTLFSFHSSNLDPTSNYPRFLGLSVQIPDILTQAQVNAPPWRMITDSQGSASWSSPAGSIPASFPFPDIFAVSASWTATTQDFSNVARLSFLPAATPIPVQSTGLSAAQLRHCGVGDVDDDGIPDLGHGLQIWKGDGSGGFGTQIAAFAEGHVVSITDCDADGFQDVVVSTCANDPTNATGLSETRVYYGDGTGTIPASPNTVLSPGFYDKGGISFSDLNSDGHLDVVISSRNCTGPAHAGGGLKVWMSTGPRTYALDFMHSGSTYCNEIGDYDGDGILDLIYSSSGSPSPRIHFMKGLASGSLMAPTWISHDRLKAGARTLTSISDLSLGRDRIAAVSGYKVCAINRNPTGGWALSDIGLTHAASLEPDLVAADWDLDGFDDLIATNSVGGTGYAQVFLNPGNTPNRLWRIQTLAGSASPPGFVRVVDLNSNGVPDLLIGGNPITTYVR